MSILRCLSAGLICVIALPCVARAGALEDISEHTKKGRTVFLVLTDAAASDLKAARAVAHAAQKQTPNSAVVELNRSDPAQRTAVARFRVAAAPVPLVLCIASNGFAVGAVRPAAKGATDRLVGMVPSPGKAEYLSVLSQKRVAAVVFSRASMSERSPLFIEISKTVKDPKSNMTAVLVDLDDARERKWVNQWKLDPKKITRPLVVFVNPKGQILGKLEGAPKAAQMLAMSKKVIRGCQDPKCKDPNCRHGK